MPGLIDRYSPLPANNRSVSAPGSRPRPAYLDATPAAAPRDTPVPRNKRGSPAAVDDDPDLDERPSRMPILLIVGALLGLGGLVVVAVAAVVAISMFGGGDDTPATPAASAGRPAPQVQVRDNMTQKPGLIGVGGEQDLPAPAPAPLSAPAPASDPAPGPAPAPEPKASVPAAAPAPAAPRRPAPTVAAPISTKGVLKIRSNRRVLVYVDGQASGYTPLEVKVEPGDHEVVAMVPGQPNTKQERDASVRAGGETVAVDFAF
jgi:hypothetical protein